MATVPCASGNSCQVDGYHPPLISGLPDDIALLCLARIPRRYHNILRCVSKRWKSLLANEEFQSCRQKHYLQESWVYAICRDNNGRTSYYVFDPNSTRRCWTCLQGVPPQCLKREGMSFETTGTKLFVLGGCSWHEDATDDVYFYDASTNAWGKATSMPTARCYFLSAVLGNKLYVANGAGMSSTPWQTWEMYDSHSDFWTKSQDRLPTDIQKLIPMNGKVHTIHELSLNVFHRGMLGPPLGDDGDGVAPNFSLCCHSPTVLVGRDLYMLDQSSGAKLMLWQQGTQEWTTVGRLSPWLVKPPCQLTAYGRTIVIVGKGLSTTAIDVDRAARVQGMTVSSYSLPELDPNLSVISCKTITL
ncbi:unnamed protein product [Spirodela intermedia]|uniref:F-box domain-containing protein n=1 Tax=Spirodela intermedia TaxID=51605 RepID=A0A7I8L7P0_SPIIN|nr:unnamed protein product [Spirodela intermedia]